MILTCPACATSYFVPDDAIGPNGRRVRCKSCGHDWRALPEDEPLELLPADPGTEAPGPTEAAESMSASLADTPAPELPKAFRAKAERRRQVRQAARQGAVWTTLVLVVLALIAAAIIFRLPLVTAWPQAAAVYKAVGLPVNVTGVEFEALRGRNLADDPSRIIAAGALRNLRDHEVVAPPVLIRLHDADGKEVDRTVIRIEAAPILPGKVQGFAGILNNPDARGVGITADVWIEPDRPAPVTITGAEVEPRAGAGVGLRSAQVDEASRPEAAPLDSRGS